MNCSQHFGPVMLEQRDIFGAAVHTANRMTSQAKAGQIIMGDAKMKLTALEKEALQKALKDLEALPDKEGDFIDMCLKKYQNVKGFNPAAYGL